MIDTDRAELAAWYWAQIDAAAGQHPEDPTGGPEVQRLVSAAICAGVAGLEVPVGDGTSVRLHELVAPYRTRPGGLTETTAAARSLALNKPYGGPRWDP